MKTPLKITSVLTHWSHPRIAILRSLPGLGDLLCIVPALRALRAAFPTATFTLIGLPQAHTFVERFHLYVDDWLEFPGFPGIPEVAVDVVKLQAFLTQVWQHPFDLVLQLHGSGRCTNAFVQLLEAPLCAGFYPTMGDCPPSRFFLPYPETGSEIWRWLNLLEFLGVPHQGWHLEFPLTAQDWHDWHAIADRVTPHAPIVCLHPGASVAARRWSASNFAEVADQLAAEGMQVVLTGTGAERSLTQAIADQMQFSAVNLAGWTSLGALAILLQQAALLICNDTGVSHLAAAVQTKSVVIFSDSDSQRWAPLDRQRHRVVQVGARSLTTPISQSAVDVQRVLTEAVSLINWECAYAS